MRILILTSKDHIYANYTLSWLIQHRFFEGKEIIVFEQDAIIPGKGNLAGLYRYLQKSGWHYVLPQLAKNLVFLCRRALCQLRRERSSPYYPYSALRNVSLRRQVYGEMKSDEAYRYVSGIRPDIILSVFSKEILPERILAIPRYGTVNVHPAFLPWHRGVSPTFWCLANAESSTGATLHYIDAGIDTGRIIAQKKIPTAGYKTEHGLYLRCTQEGTKLLAAFLRQFYARPRYPLHSRKSPRGGSYVSLPTKDAVDRFLARGYRFFRIKEFFQEDGLS